MNPLKGQDLSDYLKSMVRAGMLRQGMAEELNTLPTKEQQRLAYRRLPEACLEAARGVVRDIQLENNPPAHDDDPAVTAPDTCGAAEPDPVSSTLGEKIGGILFGLAIFACISHKSLLQAYHRLIEIRRPAAVSRPAMAEPDAPIPQLIDAAYTSGHRLRIRWTPLGDGYGYRVYLADATGQMLGAFNNDPMFTSGAVVNVAAKGQREAFIAITAMTRDKRRESRRSQLVSMKLDSRNNRYSVVPLTQ